MQEVAENDECDDFAHQMARACRACTQPNPEESLERKEAQKRTDPKAVAAVYKRLQSLKPTAQEALRAALSRTIGKNPRSPGDVGFVTDEELRNAMTLDT